MEERYLCCKVSEDLTAENLLSLGVWNDRVLDMNIDAAGGVTVSGTFYEKIRASLSCRKLKDPLS